MTPGTRLLAMARRVCSDDTLRSLVEPVVADMQHEWLTHRSHSLPGRLMILGRVYASFWCASLLHAIGATGSWLVNEIRALAPRVPELLLPTSLAVAAAAILLVAVPAASGVAAQSRWTLTYLLPQALALAIPAGLLWGVCWALSRVAAARGLSSALLAIGFAGSLISLINVTWILPEANQAWRASVYSTEDGRTPPRGPNEFGWSELREEMRRQPDAVGLRTRFYLRIAVIMTPLLFALTLPFLVAGSRRWAVAQAVAALLAYLTSPIAVTWEMIDGPSALPPLLVACGPPVSAVIVAGLLSLGQRRQQLTVARSS